jgi:hypothetical protein
VDTVLRSKLCNAEDPQNFRFLENIGRNSDRRHFFEKPLQAANYTKSCAAPCDDGRAAVFSELRNDFSHIVRQERLKGIIFYTWEGKRVAIL